MYTPDGTNHRIGIQKMFEIAEETPVRRNGTLQYPNITKNYYELREGYYDVSQQDRIKKAITILLKQGYTLFHQNVGNFYPAITTVAGAQQYGRDMNKSIDMVVDRKSVV
jgi:hypothetical protein